VVFAAPNYLAEHGRPSHPRDLARHDCVVRMGVPHPGRWVFTSSDGNEVAVNVAGRFDSNQVAAVNAGVLGGMGIGVAAFWQIQEWVEAGRVEVLLADFQLTPLPLHAMWTRTRLLVDFLAVKLGTL
jgi:DNA-binding transcriptional LysR family regulator